MLDFLEEVWDAIVDGFAYIFSFEWVGDAWDFITGMFDNLSEFSIVGLIFGFCVMGFIYALRKYMLNPFLVHMSPGSAMFWGIMTYIGSGAVGYMVGKQLFDN